MILYGLLFGFAPYHPKTQDRIERYHRSIKNGVNLENDDFPWELGKSIEAFVEYDNYHRDHESLDNLKPLDVYMGCNDIIFIGKTYYQRTSHETKKTFEF